MKPVNWSEALLLEKKLQALKGSFFQNIISSNQDLLVFFYKKGQVHYLWFDLSLSHPFCCLFDKKPSFSQISQVKTTPVFLFLKAHFKGLGLDSLSLKSRGERILLFHFKNNFLWEFRLFPKGANLIVKAGEKRISWFKVKEERVLPRADDKKFDVRSLDELESQWWLLKKESFLKKVKKSDRREEKVRKALKKIKEQLSVYKDDVYKRLAVFIETEVVPNNKPLESLPEEFRRFVDEDMTAYELLQKAYSQSKALKGKIKRLEKRQTELEVLLTKSQLEDKPTNKANLFLQSKSKGKKKDFSHCSCWIGRSGKDNLALLRYAKPWYFWLHLKDRPGAHCIVRRNKKEQINYKELEEVCQFFIQQSFRSGIKVKEGEKFDVLLTEVRFVQPIKGDRLGRVKYSKEKVMTIKVSS